MPWPGPADTLLAYLADLTGERPDLTKFSQAKLPLYLRKRYTRNRARILGQDSILAIRKFRTTLGGPRRRSQQRAQSGKATFDVPPPRGIPVAQQAGLLVVISSKYLLECFVREQRVARLKVHPRRRDEVTGVERLADSCVVCLNP